MSINQASKTAVRVLIVDDHVLIRKGLRHLVEGINGIEVVAEASNGQEAIDLAKEKEPHVVFMDIDMPSTDGIEATTQIKRLLPDVEILVISSCATGPVPAKILQAGASGYVIKGASHREIEMALNKVRNHQTYVSAELAQRLASQQSFIKDDRTPFEHLSERELEVAMLIARGKKVPMIAKELNVSSKTVNSYRYRIFAKFTNFKVDSDIGITYLAVQYGLVDDQ